MAKQYFSGEDTIKTALQLIRYNIPVLILGKSSIGKSYTLIDITKKWNIPHQLLYIGSEKSENIEGIPKITERKTDKEILEYLQPYWFPNAKVINQSVANGRKVFENFTKNFWDNKALPKFQPNYMNLNSMLNGLSNVNWNDVQLDPKTNTYTQEIILKDYEWMEYADEERVLNRRAFEVVKEGETIREDGTVDPNDDSYKRDDIADFCAYLRTVMGYGNYWLILDEIDKVLEEDQDKFAPLLHIVRERTLKNFKMVDVNNGEGIGIPLSKSFVDGKYANIIRDVNEQLDAGESVLDTRVMAIANQTKNIEDALFRRFVQLIAEKVMIWRPQDHSDKQTRVVTCLEEVKADMQDAGIESGYLRMNQAKVQHLDEVNLQWQYNFFPAILNDTDNEGNFFRQNINALFSKDSERSESNWMNERKFTAFWQILENNFLVRHEDFSLPEALWGCLSPLILDAQTSEGLSKKTKEEKILGTVGILQEKINEFGGDLDLVTADIVMNLRSIYPTTTVAEEDKLNALYAWTDRVIEYLHASIYSGTDDVKPMEIAGYLIPALTNVFYTEIANDKNFISDNMVAITEKFQGFFKQVVTDDPAFSVDCDKETTQVALYGGTPAEIEAADINEKEAMSKESLFGVSEEMWLQSASGQLAISQMDDGLAIAFPFLVEELGLDDAIDVFIEEDDTTPALDFLRANYMKELETLSNNFLAQVKSQKAAGNDTRAGKLYEAKEFIDTLLRG